MRNLITIIALLFATILTVSAQDFFMEDDTEDSFATVVSNDNAFRIGSAGEFGCRPRGGNCAAQMYRQFNEICPDGITLGTNENVLVFTCAEAITRFLPVIGSVKTIPGTMVDPSARDFRSTLAAHTLALALSLELDSNDENFAGSNHSLAKCKFKFGMFAGVTVERFLAECNKVLGGEATSMPAKLIEKQLAQLISNYQAGNYSDVLVEPASSTSFVR